MRKQIVALLTAGMLCLTAGVANADTTSLKIGVIDVQQIMQKSPQVAAMNQSLSKQFKPRQEKIIAAQKSLQDEVDKLNKNGATMSAADKSKLQDQITNDRNTVQNMVIGFQHDLQAAQSQDMQSFMSSLVTAVNSVAKSGGYDLILQRNGVPYVGSNLDVTSQVLDALKK